VPSSATASASAMFLFLVMTNLLERDRWPGSVRVT